MSCRSGCLCWKLGSNLLRPNDVDDPFDMAKFIDESVTDIRRLVSPDVDEESDSEMSDVGASKDTDVAPDGKAKPSRWKQKAGGLWASPSLKKGGELLGDMVSVLHEVSKLTGSFNPNACVIAPRLPSHGELDVSSSPAAVVGVFDSTDSGSSSPKQGDSTSQDIDVSLDFVDEHKSTVPVPTNSTDSTAGSVVEMSPSEDTKAQTKDTNGAKSHSFASALKSVFSKSSAAKKSKSQNDDTEQKYELEEKDALVVEKGA